MRVAFLTLVLAATLGVSALAQTPPQPARVPVSPAVATEAPSLAVVGTVGRSPRLTNAALAAQFAAEIKSVHYTVKGKPHVARCVPLLALIRAVTLRPYAPKRKNPFLSFVVVVTGVDGYTVAFSWAELSPEYGNTTVYIALDRDGVPLPADVAPAELIVIGDKKPSRFVHAIRKIVVRDLALAPR